MYYLFKFLKLIFYWSCGFGIYLWTLDFSFMKDQQSIKVLTFIKVKVKVAQSCLTLCDPVDYTVHGILQARILEWVAFPFSRGIFPTQGLNPGLLHWRQLLYQLSHKGSPNIHNTEMIKCRKLMGIKVKRMALEKGRSALVRKCWSPTTKGKGKAGSLQPKAENVLKRNLSTHNGTVYNSQGVKATCVHQQING